MADAYSFIDGTSETDVYRLGTGKLVNYDSLNHALYLSSSAEELYLQAEESAERRLELEETFHYTETVGALERLHSRNVDALIKRWIEGKDLQTIAKELRTSINGAGIRVRWASFLFGIALLHEREGLPIEEIEPLTLDAEGLLAFQPIGAIGRLSAVHINTFIQDTILEKSPATIARDMDITEQQAIHYIIFSRLLYDIAKQQETNALLQSSLDVDTMEPLIKLSSVAQLYNEAIISLLYDPKGTLIDHKDKVSIYQGSIANQTVLAEFSLARMLLTEETFTHVLTIDIPNVSDVLLTSIPLPEKTNVKQEESNAASGVSSFRLRFQVRTNEELQTVIDLIRLINQYR